MEQGVGHNGLKLGIFRRRSLIATLKNKADYNSLYQNLTMWDLCTIDWPKEDTANFESQNFEGP